MIKHESEKGGTCCLSSNFLGAKDMITVGFTYDLRDDYLAQGYSLEQTAEFDSHETIEAIDAALTENGFHVERIGNIKALVNQLARGSRWDIVFNICEGIKGIGRESQVPALLEAYDIPFVFSSSDVTMLTMNKAWAKMVVREHDVPTAPFLVVEKISDLDRFDLPFPVFVKPIAEGTSKGVTSQSLVTNYSELKGMCLSIMNKFDQPALVETYLSGEDATVGIYGCGDAARVIGVMKPVFKKGSEKGIQSYYNKENWQDVLDYDLVDGNLAKAMGDCALKSWQALGCTDGGRVDIRCDHNGVPNFIEVNPLAGLRPDYSDLCLLSDKVGMNYVELIGNIMASALDRYDITPFQRKKIAVGHL